MEKENISLIILIIFALILCVFYVFNFINIKKTNDNYEILQKYKPNREDIIDLTRNKLPVILIGVIEDWFIYDKNDKIDQKKLTAEVLNENTELLNNALTLNKNYEINNINTKLKNSKLIQENNVRHFLCLLSGSISIFLFNPQQKIEYIINDNKLKESKYSFWNEEKEHLKETKYMEINLGAEQIIFIPYGWWYCYQVKEEGIILDIESQTIFTGPIKFLL
jgi:hypothetical protein